MIFFFLLLKFCWLFVYLSTGGQYCDFNRYFNFNRLKLLRLVKPNAAICFTSDEYKCCNKHLAHCLLQISHPSFSIKVITIFNSSQKREVSYWKDSLYINFIMRLFLMIIYSTSSSSSSSSISTDEEILFRRLKRS